MSEITYDKDELANILDYGENYYLTSQSSKEDFNEALRELVFFKIDYYETAKLLDEANVDTEDWSVGIILLLGKE